jgi:hypothetical protein
MSFFDKYDPYGLYRTQRVAIMNGYENAEPYRKANRMVNNPCSVFCILFTSTLYLSALSLGTSSTPCTVEPRIMMLLTVIGIVGLLNIIFGVLTLIFLQCYLRPDTSWQNLCVPCLTVICVILQVLAFAWLVAGIDIMLRVHSKVQYDDEILKNTYCSFNVYCLFITLIFLQSISLLGTCSALYTYCYSLDMSCD